MADLDFVDDDSYTKAEIQDFVRQWRDDVPELSDVSLYQNKPDLIEDVNAALDAHLDAQAEADGEEVEEFTGEEEAEVEKETKDEDGAGARGQAGSPPFSRDAGPSGEDLLG